MPEMEKDWRDRFNLPRDLIPRDRRDLAELSVSLLSNHDFLNLFSAQLDLRSRDTMIGDNTFVIDDEVEGQAFDVQIADHDPIYDLPKES